MNPNPKPGEDKSASSKDDSTPTGDAGKARQQPSGQQQQQGGDGQQHGEGNYQATRDYNAGLKEHVEHHDIEREARDAAPRSASEEKEMEEAERIGKSKSRGEGGKPGDTPGQDGGAK